MRPTVFSHMHSDGVCEQHELTPLLLSLLSSSPTSFSFNLDRLPLLACRPRPLASRPSALRIHEETERGDNDSIKQKKEAAVAQGGARRRRRRGESGDAEAAPVGCCGGAGAA